jgi:hypothetical protein
MELIKLSGITFIFGEIYRVFFYTTVAVNMSSVVKKMLAAFRICFHFTPKYSEILLTLPVPKGNKRLLE